MSDNSNDSDSSYYAPITIRFKDGACTDYRDIEEILNLENKHDIVYLDGNNCQINDIPPRIYELINLEELILCDNYILNLPKEIGNLKNLKTLWMTDIHLLELPKEIGKLENLETLMMHTNYVKYMPNEIKNCKKLECIHYDGEIECDEEIEDFLSKLPDASAY